MDPYRVRTLNHEWSSSFMGILCMLSSEYISTFLPYLDEVGDSDSDGSWHECENEGDGLP